jgi:formyltetrahydrofolate deformylase
VATPEPAGVGRQGERNGPPECLLTLSCPDRRGIVAAVSTYLSGIGCDIPEAAQFGDPDSGLFFMRVHILAQEPGLTLDAVRAGFADVAARFGMTWQLYDLSVRMRLMILVSRFGHCLNDLLYRQRSGALPVDVPAVVSNHPDLGELVASYGVPFHHLPVTAATRDEQEAALLEIIRRERIDLVVLARYMQVLSPALCRELTGRVINIHHSFLPSFSGARPYHQAHARGVKLIGATAHYVTADLDQGPIIEQDVARVTHAASPEMMTAIGREVENRVLGRAVGWHVERRVLINGNRTVVFS